MVLTVCTADAWTSAETCVKNAGLAPNNLLKGEIAKFLSS